MTRPTAAVSTTVQAPAEKVWTALTTPTLIKRYFFDADVVSDWHEGSPILFSGEWQGQRYEDRGVIKDIEEPLLLSYYHWSALSGKPDRPENYDLVTYALSERGDETVVTVTQAHAIDAGDDEPEAERRVCEENWSKVLDGLKQVVEH